jgi:hypothetical protein
MKKSALFFCFLLLFACNRVKEKAKETIHEAGEKTAKTASEFGKGISDGVSESFVVTISPSENISKQGIKIGKIILSGSENSVDNKLSVYLIFEKDFKGDIKLKVSDKNGLEMGRSSLEIEAKADSAAFYDFVFDKRTNIDFDSKVVME